MDGGPIGRLTEKQRACLRLVQRHYTSKQIARELGIGADAVDQRIKTAMKKLGVSSRTEAARLLTASEVVGTPKSVTVETNSVVLARSFRWFASRLKQLRPATGRSRLAFWSSFVAFVLGLIHFGAPIDFLLRDWSSLWHRHSASGDIVIVAIERPNVGHSGAVWSRSQFAELTDRLDSLGSERVAFSMLLDLTTAPKADRDLAAALQRLDRRAILVAGDDTFNGKRVTYYPLPEFRRSAALSNGAAVSMLWSVRGLPYSMEVGGVRLPSLAAELAGWLPQPQEPSIGVKVASLEVIPPRERWFLIDYSIDPRTIPVVDAEDVLRDKVSRSNIEGKISVIARTYVEDTPPRAAPLFGMFPYVYIHVLGAETLKQGPPTAIAWTLPFLWSLIVVIACVRRRNRYFSLISIGGSIALLLFLPFALNPSIFFIEVSTPILLLSIVGSGFAWASLRQTRSRPWPKSDVDSGCAAKSSS